MSLTQRPPKRTKIFDDSDEGSDSGVRVSGGAEGFKINEEYARRFEHNKKRTERHQLEEKYGNTTSFKRKRDSAEDQHSDDDSSTGESEDDDAELATADVDEEILATLQAIKSKDPKVYDSNVKFYREYDPDAAENTAKKEKPMYLQDYHRQNLLAGHAGTGEEEDVPVVQTYQQEQDQLKRELVGSMHAAGKDEDSGDDFMVAKSKPKHDNLPAMKTKPKNKITESDIKEADKDPETFLSNFMAARAWLPTDGSRFQPLESDDSDDEKRADEFEEAYNMRFEDPNTANEKLQSFARDVGKYGVRRDEPSGRAKAREREREQKSAARRERDEDKARLRKLKIEEAEEKVKRIKEAAGLRGQELDLEKWRDVIEGDFDDTKWEEEMKRRFGEDYYAEQDNGIASDDQEVELNKGNPKKPQWDDDIDIKDLVPEFEDEDKAEFLLTDEEDGGAPVVDEGEEEVDEGKKRKTKKDREKEKSDAKRAARKERRKIEEMVDAALPLQDPSLTSAATSRAPVVGFRYRETSPTTFGMSARDILFADDTQLNQYAGLKKLHAFRDSDRKERDRKKLGKKQRLQKWRKETFGKSSAPSGGFEKILGYPSADVEADAGAEKGDGVKDKDGSKKKRKRSKKGKGVGLEA